MDDQAQKAAPPSVAEPPSEEPPKQPSIIEAFQQGTPMQRMLGEVYERLGGLDFIEDWAEENPGDFMRILLASNPPPTQAPGAAGGQTLHLHMHPALAAGPLDGKVVSEQ